MAAGEPGALLLAPLPGWRSDLLDRVAIDKDAVRLATLPGPPRPLNEASGDFGGLTLPAALAVDREGRIYVLHAENAALRRYNPCDERFEALACIGGEGWAPRRFHLPRAIAISCRDELYVVDTGNRRIQIFALDSLALRGVWGPYAVKTQGQALRAVPAEGQPETDPVTGQRTGRLEFPPGSWEPYGIVLAPDRRAFVSDRANGLVHVFDASGAWLRAIDGVDANGVALSHPTAIAGDPAGRLYIVQEGVSDIVVLDAEGRFLERVTQKSAIADRFQPVTVAVDGAGVIYISDRISGLTSRIRRDRAGRCLTPEPVPTIPANCPVLAFDAGGNPVLGSPQQPCVIRTDDVIAYQNAGVFRTAALDSLMPRCQWGHIELRLSLPFGTTLELATTTQEVELGSDEVAALTEDRWTTTPINGVTNDGRWNCLVRSDPGRYLWLRLGFGSDGAASPEIRSIDLDWPRRTSRRFLPAVYAEDPVGGDFLDRLLAIFDRVHGGAVERIAHIAARFDPRATPASPAGDRTHDFLDWLGAWLGLTLQHNWSVARRRRLVANAYRLYRLRGTLAGLKLHVELFTGVEPRILEHFKLRRWLNLGAARLGSRSALWGPEIVKRLQLDVYAEIGKFQLVDTGDPLTDPFDAFAHRFTVYAAVPKSFSPADAATLSAIVEMAKPAHSDATLRLVQPRFVVGRQSCIGVDSVIGIDSIIGKRSQPAVLGDAVLGDENRLGPPLRPGASRFRLGPRVRVGIDTRLA
jgi:phage tail-like protein